MLVRYEKLDEYMEAIIKNLKAKEQPVYISILRTQDDENNLVSQIYIQTVSVENNNLILTHCYTELPSIKVVSPSLFDSAFGVNETSVAAKKNYDADFLQTTNTILGEKAKIINKLKELGFTKFVDAFIQ